MVALSGPRFDAEAVSGCLISEVGGEYNREIASCRACARSGCLMELDRKRGFVLFPFGAGNFPFSRLPFGSFPFPLCE